MPLKSLFVADTPSDVDDDSRMLMDDLGISKGSVSRNFKVGYNLLLSSCFNTQGTLSVAGKCFS